MNRKKLSELVAAAKGEDRSMRKYASDSGVDVAVIQKIISGKYIPKKPDVYYKLTTETAAPRGGITAADLIEASGKTNDFQLGVDAGVSTTMSTVFTILGKAAYDTMAEAVNTGLNILGDVFFDEQDQAPSVRNSDKDSEEKKTVDDNKAVVQSVKERAIYYNPYNLYSEESKRFKAISEGMIYAKLAMKGIIAVPAENRNPFQTDLSIQDQRVKEYNIRYIFISQDTGIEQIVRNVIIKKLTPLIALPLNSERKISFVTNSEEVYRQMSEMRGKMSFRGDLSVILADMDEVRLIKEIYLIHYNEPDTASEMLIV